MRVDANLLRHQRVDLQLQLAPYLATANAPQELQDMLADTLVMLRSAEHSLRGSGENDAMETRRGGRQYKAVKMLAYLLCARNVKDSNQLMKTTRHMLSALLPEAWVQDLCSSGSHNT